MSGPKVVRIVTVEEVTATCKGLLARLEQAMQQWKKRLNKLGEEDENYYQSMLEKRKNFEQMLEDQRFLEIQKLVPMEMDNLVNNIKQRRQLKVNSRVDRAIEQRQLKENIKALVALLKNKQVIIDDELSVNLQQAMEGRYQGNIHQLLARAFDLLVPQQSDQLSAKQQALLTRMEIDNSKQTFNAWLEQQNIVLQDDPYTQKIESYLAELALEQSAIYDLFVTRLKDIEQDLPTHRKKLLLDSVLLDLAQAVNEAKERSSLQSQLELLIAELQQKTTDILDFDLTTLETANIKELKVLLCNAQQKSAEVTQAITASYRQQAILQGLASLGYEVQQGMQTQWAKEGRLLIRNPATPGYGIELAGKAEAARMQVRAVRFTGEDDKQRDKDIETLWCGDFGKLQQWLTKQGSGLVIEKTLPVGQTALKQVAMTASESVESMTVEKQTSFHR